MPYYYGPAYSRRGKKRPTQARQAVLSKRYETERNERVIAKVRAYLQAQGLLLVGMPVPIGGKGQWMASVKTLSEPLKGQKPRLVYFLHTDVEAHDWNAGLHRTARERRDVRVFGEGYKGQWYHEGPDPVGGIRAERK